ncbi:MAG: TIGR00282 family metallophosphoesterase [Alphaproteobacteria bacterium]
MRLLYCGDVVGRSGRDVVEKLVPKLRREEKLDAVVVNVDNAAGGFGINSEIIRDFAASGVDVMPGGDHVFDQKDALSLLGSQNRLLRPHNFPPSVPGTGCRLFTLENGKKLLVLHLLGQVFHKEYLDSPFTTADAALAPYKLGGNVDAILVDMHAEATSEKMAMGKYLDGRVTAVVGSHTHVPTADARVLPKGTAYLTDAGMCGDYDSIIGFDPEGPMQNFLHKHRKIRMEPASGPGTLCGAIIDVKPDGLAESITPIQMK